MTHTVDVERCTRCGACRLSCPMNLLEPGDTAMTFVDQADTSCMRCGHCIAACPEDAITIDGLDASMFPSISNPADYDALQNLLLGRRSVRRFIQIPVDKESIDRILDAVATAPSGMGAGPSPICVIDGRDKIDPLIPPMMEFYRKFQQGMKGRMSKGFMRLMLGKNHYSAMKTFIPVMDQMIEYYDQTGEETITWGAPLLLIFHAPRTDISGDKDAVIACTYAMLAAHAMGLGTTMIGMVPPYLENKTEVKHSLGIPLENTAVLSLIVGHPAAKFARGIKRPVTARWV